MKMKWADGTNGSNGANGVASKTALCRRGARQTTDKRRQRRERRERDCGIREDYGKAAEQKLTEEQNLEEGTPFAAFATFCSKYLCGLWNLL